MNDHDKVLDHECRISKIEGLLTNHIPHIQRAVDDVRGDIKELRALMMKVLVTAVFAALGFVANIILKFLVR